MAIDFHPAIGTIVMCNYDEGFKVPEMRKTRPAIVISPPIRVRANLATVVPISTSPPMPEMPYHYRLTIDPPLSKKFDATEAWVKCDMVCAVSFERLSLIRNGKDITGKRIYRIEPISDNDLRSIRACVLKGLGLATLTNHL
ncbi:MAG: type II toxin-antitoxin system PemK/MazF family toxin [Kordiimonadaceae bacterium]|nr:type II toxin-antitoxin system PemK/MazF family toxin [Kordiimonadaceae bacterium]